MLKDTKIRLFVESGIKVDLKEDLAPEMREVARKFFSLVKEEFEGSFWRSPSGAKINWAPRRGGTNRLLIKSGKLMRGATGESGDGIFTVAKKSWGVRIKVGYAYIHRGGTTLSPTGKLFGIIPRRFATDNPEIREYFAAKVKEGLLRGVNGAKNNSG